MAGKPQVASRTTRRMIRKPGSLRRRRLPSQFLQSTCAPAATSAQSTSPCPHPAACSAPHAS
eukprot:2288937-Pyramimonas_sp.AAC.1